MGFWFGLEAGEDVGDRESLFEPAQVQAAVVAAVFIDREVQFIPQRMVGRDAEITADVGEDGTNLLTPDLGGDLVWGGQVWLGPWRTRLRHAWRAGGWGWFRLGFGVDASSGGGYFLPEQASAEHALGNAGENQGDITGAEVAGKLAWVVGGGALAERRGELCSVVDEFADEREETAGAAWWR